MPIGDWSSSTIQILFLSQYTTMEAPNPTTGLRLGGSILPPPSKAVAGIQMPFLGNLQIRGGGQLKDTNTTYYLLGLVSTADGGAL